MMGVTGPVEASEETNSRQDSLGNAFNEFNVHPSYSSSGLRLQHESYSSAAKESTEIFGSEAAQADVTSPINYKLLIFQLRNHRQLTELHGTLKTAVLEGKIDAKEECELLLGRLCSQNVEYWAQALSSIELLLPLVEYKNVHDVIELFFDKVNEIPSTVNISRLKQLDALHSLVASILDRSSALYPSYLLLDDIHKRLSANDGWPHWKIAGLISAFVDSFRPLAKLVTVVGRSRLVPVVDHTSSEAIFWMLHTATAKFALKGYPSYNKEAQKTRTMLVRSVLNQPYSSQTVSWMLDLVETESKRCVELENQVVDLIVAGMRRSEEESLSSPSLCQFWHTISLKLIYFTFCKHTSFPALVNALYTQLSASGLRRGRTHLMWVLLEYTSRFIQEKPLSDFLPLLDLYDLLYTETKPLPFPEMTDPNCTRQLAFTSIWVHLMTKAYKERGLQRSVPVASRIHCAALAKAFSYNLTSERWIPMLCNAYSTNEKIISSLMYTLTESIAGKSGLVIPTRPLSIDFLDSMTVHVKMILIHEIVCHLFQIMEWMQQAALKPMYEAQPGRRQPILAPAFLETFARLSACDNYGSMGITELMPKLLPAAVGSQAWHMVHTFLEMCCYRLYHIKPLSRMNLLSHLHSLASLPETNHPQLQLCFDLTTLKLITGLGNDEVYLLLPHLQAKAGLVMSNDSEEFNKVFVLTLARALNIRGPDSSSIARCQSPLHACVILTPHNWSDATFACFPSWVAEFFKKYQRPRQEKAYLLLSLEGQYRIWSNMKNENKIIAHFSRQERKHLFVCLLWKMLMEDGQIYPLAYTILERIEPRILPSCLRTFSDALVHEVANCESEVVIQKYINAVNDLIWKYHIVPLDRFILILSLRSYTNDELLSAINIVQMLLTESKEFKDRMREFVSKNSPDHWMRSDWFEKNLQFHQLFPERYILPKSDQYDQYYPPYFGNICLRILPVLDIVVHRFIELSTNSLTSIETILRDIGVLYRFHDRPLTYLYNTLHYYDETLRVQYVLKLKLVRIITVGRDSCLTDNFRQFLYKAEYESSAMFTPPDIDYYRSMLHRVVEVVDGKDTSVVLDWRFNEFRNAGAYTIHVSCIELMALPLPPKTVVNGLLDVVLHGHTGGAKDVIPELMNAIGLLMTALPDAYKNALDDRIVELIWALPEDADIIESMNLTGRREVYTESFTLDTVALVHAVWSHATTGQISRIPALVSKKLKPVITRENQMLLLCQLVAPFFPRLDLAGCIIDITRGLYEILEIVDKTQTRLRYMDSIVDLFYHIKHIYTCDPVNAEVEHIISNLRPELQHRLRFVTYPNVPDSKQNFEPSVILGSSQQMSQQQNHRYTQHQSQMQEQQQVFSSSGHFRH